MIEKELYGIYAYLPNKNIVLILYGIEIRHNNIKKVFKKYKQNTKHFIISFKGAKK